MLCCCCHRARGRRCSELHSRWESYEWWCAEWREKKNVSGADDNHRRNSSVSKWILLRIQKKKQNVYSHCFSYSNGVILTSQKRINSGWNGVRTIELMTNTDNMLVAYIVYMCVCGNTTCHRVRVSSVSNNNLLSSHSVSALFILFRFLHPTQ